MEAVLVLQKKIGMVCSADLARYMGFRMSGCLFSGRVRSLGGDSLNIQNLVDDYTSWLKSEIYFDKIGEFYEITTPYLDNANDYLQIYVKQEGNDIFLQMTVPPCIA